MQSIQKTVNTTNPISASFAGREISFAHPRGATFADLADRLDRHRGGLRAISLKFDVAEQPVCRFDAVIRPACEA